MSLWGLQGLQGRQDKWNEFCRASVELVDGCMRGSLAGDGDAVYRVPSELVDGLGDLCRVRFGRAVVGVGGDAKDETFLRF